MARMLAYSILGIIAVTTFLPFFEFLFDVMFYVFVIIGFITTLYFSVKLKNKIYRFIYDRKTSQIYEEKNHNFEEKIISKNQK